MQFKKSHIYSTPEGSAKMLKNCLVIDILTVLGQSWKAASGNPANALRYE